MHLPLTQGRVPAHTAEHVNDRIYQNMLNRLQAIGSDDDLIARRLRQLDEEWDIERTVEVRSSVVVLGSLILGVTVSRKFFAVSALAAGSLLQFGLQGWAFPVPALRRLGYRTSHEIEIERTALKLMRGDLSEDGARLSPRAAFAASFK